MMITIVKSDGTLAGPMAQLQAERYLMHVMGNSVGKKGTENGTADPNLTQALNDVTNPGGGKATKPWRFNGYPVLHASAGKKGTKGSASVFFYRLGETNYIFALGKHVGEVKGEPAYSLDYYGRNNDPIWKKGSTIALALPPK